MKNPISRSKNGLTSTKKDLWTFFAMTLLTAITFSIYALRIGEEPFTPNSFFFYFLLVIPACTIIYVMPLLMDAYAFVVPILGTLFMTLLLISSASVKWRMIAENTPDSLDVIFNMVLILGLALIISFFYMVLGGLASADRRKSGLPPYCSDISAKTKKIVLIVLASALLVTGITTSVIHQVQLHLLKPYVVSCEDYTPLLNFKISADASTSEQMSTSLLRTEEYASIEGVDHHDFLQVVIKYFGIKGGDESAPILLQSKHLGMDFPKEAPSAEIHLVGKDYESQKETYTKPDDALAQYITQVVRGDTASLSQVPQPFQVKSNVYPDLGNCVYARVYFEGYDAFYWQAQVMSYEDMLVLAITENSQPDKELDHREIKMVYYMLPLSK